MVSYPELFNQSRLGKILVLYVLNSLYLFNTNIIINVVHPFGILMIERKQINTNRIKIKLIITQLYTSIYIESM